MTAIDVVAVSKSPFTSAMSVFAHPGEYWQASVKTPPMRPDNAEPWISTFMSLRGQYGTILLGDSARKTPRGAVSGSPVVNGGSQTGFELSVRSLPLSTAGVLLAGDYIQIGTGADSRLHKVMKDATSNGSGIATLDIWPRIRTSPADGAAIIYSNPVGVFRRDSNEMPWTWDIPVVTSITMGFVEAL